MDMRWLIANGACGTHTKLYMKHVMSNKHVWNDNQAQNWPSFLIRLVTYSPFIKSYSMMADPIKIP